MVLPTAEQVRHPLDRPAALQPMVVRLANLGRDAGPRAPHWHHLGLSLSPSVPCIPIAEAKARVLDVDSKPFELRTLQRTSTDAIQEAS